MIRVLAFATFLFSGPVQAELNADVLSGQVDAAQIDRLIADNFAQPRLVFDLLGLKAAAAEDAGRWAASADAVEAQIELAEQHRRLIAHDIAGLQHRAAKLRLKAGQNNDARRLLNAALRELEDSAAPDHRFALVQETLDAAPPERSLRPRIRPFVFVPPLPSMIGPPPRQVITSGVMAPFASVGPDDDVGYRTVQVFYATDRAQTGQANPAEFYGPKRANALEYGVTEVSVPNLHQPGVVETPSVWRLEFAPNPTKHIMLQSVTPVDKEDFFAGMRGTLAAQNSSDAFVYVHGFNLSFEIAAKRTAQLAYDMNFGGVPILYSWPSMGATTGYVSDTAVVRLSGRRLTLFLDDLVERSGATTIHIIAHSMGNRAVTDALELMALRHQPLDDPLFGQVIFAAPDVDKGLFEAMMPTIRPLAQRLTLYASENDWALLASRALHGDAPRAGQAGDDPVQHQDVDTVDMSALGEDLLTHVYVSNDESAILDVSMMFWRDLPPDARCGLNRTGSFWTYQEAGCGDPNLMPLLAALRNEGIFTGEGVAAYFDTHYPGQSDMAQLRDMLVELAQQPID